MIYKPKIKKLYGKWYVVNFIEAIHTEFDSEERKNFWKAYSWVKTKNWELI